MASTLVIMELEDIQGLLIRGHKEMAVASYLMLRITDEKQAKEWLKELLPHITNGVDKPDDVRQQLAFTHEGITKISSCELYGFAIEYTQGIATDFRSRVLGDLDESAPSEWQWGNPKDDPIHMVLMVYAKDENTLEAHLKNIEASLANLAIVKVTQLDAPRNELGKEHFGFRDGITQPTIEGLSKSDSSANTLKAGEFILGYKNGYDQLPESPLLNEANDLTGILPLSNTNNGYKDFGKNGSYMVFRQLSQHVEDFWNQAKDAAKQIGLSEENCVFAASKMVGRWPNGKPITQAPDNEKPFDIKEKYFLYRDHNDLSGHQCPLGAHIRRSNPRDVLPDNNPESSVTISNLHRILRRGRNYGAPLDESMDPAILKDLKDDGQERGLHFICFNTNISRQFEFVQHMWCNNTKFSGQYNDPDPVLGIKDHRDKSKMHEFTIQADPVRKKVRGLTRHVEVVGGAYFFMPGIKALTFLANK